VIGGKMTVNPEGAEVVRLIFHKYLQERKGCSTIARELREAGILSSKGNCLWSSATVTKILKNEKYCGDLIQKKTYTPDFLTHEKKYNHGKEPLVWRNLFFPTEVLNALGVRSLTLETYAALFARSQHKVKKAFDKAACKGFSGETCSFLRVLEGVQLPAPAFGVSTSQPCQQGERIFRDLARTYGASDKFFSLQTPAVGEAEGDITLEHLAEELERSVRLMEKSLGLKMDPAKLAEACEHSNEARHYSLLCNELRHSSPPLIRGGQAIYFATIFSQLWGRPELTAIQKTLFEELRAIRDEIGDSVKLEDTHRLLWLHLPPFYDSSLLDYIEVKCKACSRRSISSAGSRLTRRTRTGRWRARS